MITAQAVGDADGRSTELLAIAIIGACGHGDRVDGNGPTERSDR